MAWRKNKKKSRIRKAAEMKFKLERLKRERHDYYLKLIIDLMEGAHQSFTEVINLSRVKGVYGYYQIDDTIIYYDDTIKKALLEEDISSYFDSSNGLIVTSNADRVSHQKSK
jgi:hypothetical protein